METDWALWAIYLKKGQSQRKTCNRLGVSEGVLCQMIFKGIPPSIKTLMKIADARKMSLWELVREAEHLTQKNKAEYSLEEYSA